MRILIVEGSSIYLRLLRGSLVTVLAEQRMCSYTIEVARSASEARMMLYVHERFDLIIVDAELPDEPGLRLVRWIRQGGQSRWMPIVMVANSGRDCDVLEALQNGVDDYVLKPLKEGRFEHRARVLIGELLRLG